MRAQVAGAGDHTQREHRVGHFDRHLALQRGAVARLQAGRVAAERVRLGPGLHAGTVEQAGAEARFAARHRAGEQLLDVDHDEQRAADARYRVGHSAPRALDHRQQQRHAHVGQGETGHAVVAPDHLAQALRRVGQAPEVHVRQARRRGVRDLVARLQAPAAAAVVRQQRRPAGAQHMHRLPAPQAQRLVQRDDLDDVAALHVQRRDAQAHRRLLQAALYGLRGALGLARELLPHASLVARAELDDGAQGQRSEQQLRQCIAHEPRPPIAARLGQQRQHHRRDQQDAERIRQPPAQPRGQQVARRRQAAEAEQPGGQRGAEHAAEAAERGEAADRRHCVELQAGIAEPLEQHSGEGGMGGLHCHERQRQPRRTAEVGVGPAGDQHIGGQRPESDAGQHAETTHQQHADCHAGGREQRQRLVEAAAEGQPRQQPVGQRKTQRGRQPAPGRGGEGRLHRYRCSRHGDTRPPSCRRHESPGASPRALSSFARSLCNRCP